MIQFFVIQKVKSDQWFSRHAYSKHEIIADFERFDTDYKGEILQF